MNIYLCPSPELYPLYHRAESIVIIVDIFRASTTMVAAFAHGAKGIKAVATTEEAELEGRRLGALIAAERNIVRCPVAQLGNDPAEYTTELVSGREIVFTTTNGTRALTIAQEQGAKEILVGALTNLQATIDYCRQAGRDVVILAAGWKGQVSMEDFLYAGAFAFQSHLRGAPQLHPHVGALRPPTFGWLRGCRAVLHGPRPLRHRPSPRGGLATSALPRWAMNNQPHP